MRSRAAIAAVALSFSALALAEEPAPTPPDPASWSDAYSRRDFRLGISRKEFLETPFPDLKTRPGAFPVCSDEPRAEVPFDAAKVSPEWEAAGAVKCVFFTKVDARGRPAVVPITVSLEMGGVSSFTEFYFIRSAPGRKLRLFLITSDGPTREYDELMLTFAAALGKPKDVRFEKVKSKAGAEFENTTTIWTNKSSMIVAERYSGDLNTLLVKHVLNDLWDVFEANLEKLRAEKAKKL